MNHDDENVLLSVIMEMTPLTKFPTLQDWYIKFKAKMGVLAPDLEFEIQYTESPETKKTKKKSATTKKKKGKKHG